MNSLVSVYWHLAHIVSRLSSELEILYRCIDPGFLKRYVMGVEGCDHNKIIQRRVSRKQTRNRLGLSGSTVEELLGEAMGLVTEGVGALEARMRDHSPGHSPLTTSECLASLPPHLNLGMLGLPWWASG